MNSDLLRQLTTRSEPQERFYGVVVGIVTNNQDPENLHRVKVQFPWLDGSTESHWARVATPMAGKNRGLYFLPEVDDEVLVAFEHGSIDFPCVIGSLWNGKDTPPESNSDRQNNNRALAFAQRSYHPVRRQGRRARASRSSTSRGRTRSSSAARTTPSRSPASRTSRSSRPPES